jgi:hypothetical protein
MLITWLTWRKHCIESNQMSTFISFRSALIAAAVPILILGAPRSATAQTVVVRERVVYPIEIEPHFSFGAEDVYGAAGFGGGLRVGIPFAHGHLGRIPDNVAISFGGDIVHYDDCYNGSNCNGNYLMFPVAAQWNIGFVRSFSFLLEGGAYVYKGWYDTCGAGCSGPSDFGILPTIAAGGRVHLGDNVALLFRIGYPMSTVGISFY